MSKKVGSVIVCLAFTLVFTSDALAQRGRGGGGRAGGGGGARMSGGGMAGGGASHSMNRSPSMSRPSPSMNRPSQPMARPTPSVNRPAAGGSLSSGTSRPSISTGRPTTTRPAVGSGVAGSGRAGAGQLDSRIASGATRPTQSDLGNFLNMPDSTAARTSTGGARTARSGEGGNAPGSRSASASPMSAPEGGSRTFTTEGGTTITVGGSSGSGTTAGGVQVGGAVGGIKIETAGGETFGRVSAVGGATDGTNSAVRGGSITGAQDGQGNAAVNVRGGYADSSGYRQGGSITGTRDQYGYSTVTGRGGYGYGNGTGQIGSVAAVRTPSGNVVSAGRGGAFVNGQFVGGQSWSAVNGSYTHWNAFGPGYYNNYPNAWWPGKWAVATTAWATATYAMAGAYCGCSSEGTYYDYGENVTYEDGTVYQDGEAVATADEYYQQADELSQTNADSENEEWMPLGVFAVIVEGQTQTDKVVQLALNRDGVIRGNFQDLVLDQVIPVRGAVDKETQRVAIKLEGNDTIVIETGLYNLTNDEVPVLVHFDAQRQEARTLIRLQNPEEQGQAEGQNP